VHIINYAAEKESLNKQKYWHGGGSQCKFAAKDFLALQTFLVLLRVGIRLRAQLQVAARQQLEAHNKMVPRTGDNSGTETLLKLHNFYSEFRIFGIPVK
jgi:hypothetical protein